MENEERENKTVKIYGEGTLRASPPRVVSE